MEPFPDCFCHCGLWRLDSVQRGDHGDFPRFVIANCSSTCEAFIATTTAGVSIAVSRDGAAVFRPWTTPCSS